jgi:hypothetical protein
MTLLAAGQTAMTRSTSDQSVLLNLNTICGGDETFAGQGNDYQAATYAASRLTDAWEKVRTALEQLLPEGIET